MEFIAHNILLKNHTKTRGDAFVLTTENSWWKAAHKTIDLFLPDADKSGLRAVDLGCLEGGYSVALAQAGFQTTGIEARTENYEKCMYVKQHVDLPNLQFAKDDARNIDQYGIFDVTFCYGLLYHLDDPAAFLKKVSSCTSKLLLLHTHFALEHDSWYQAGTLNRLLAPVQKRIPMLNRRRNYKLSKLTTHEGYKGRWYREWHSSAQQEKIEKNLEASYNNPRSFWPTKKDLTKALHDAGFNSVFEQFDFTGDTTPENYTDYNQRTMFVAIKH